MTSHSKKEVGMIQNTVSSHSSPSVTEVAARIAVVLAGTFLAILFAINPSAGRVGPEVLLGWPNRFMVLAYSIWLILLALRAAPIAAILTDKKELASRPTRH
jgi:hypothetical protein